MANYGPGAEYLPQEGDAKECFDNQLKATDKAAKQLKSEIMQLERQIISMDTAAAKDSDAFYKLEHLKATVSVYLSIKRMLRTKDIAMADRYEGLADGADELASMARVYREMTALLDTLQARMHHILAAPDGWFKIQFVKMKTWLEQNPKTAAAYALACGATVGAATGAYAWVHGHCIIYYLLSGCSCTSGGIGSSMALGAGLGLTFGGLAIMLVGGSIAAYNYTYCDASEKTQTDMQKINAMAARLETLTDRDFLNELGELLDLCDRVIPANIPDPADRMCVICFGEAHEVLTPVKAPRCKGSHFMCKEHFVQLLGTHGDKCPVCRV